MEAFLGCGLILMGVQFAIKLIINPWMGILYCIGLCLIRVGILQIKIIFQ